MRKSPLFTAALVGALLITGCNTENKTPSSVSIAEENQVALVNGEPISRSALDYLSAELAKHEQTKGVPREQLLEELINRELLSQEAEQKKLQDDPEVATRLNMAHRTVLSQAAIETFMENHPISEEALKSEYDKRVGAMDLTEYKARHILTETEEEARKVIQELEKGTDFAKLAKEHSTGPSAEEGGDLGWFLPQRMVPPFANAVIALENGQFTQEPVKTQFGWHVILREDARQKEPPSYESVKPQLVNLLQREQLQKHIQELRAKADIVIKEKPPSGEAEQGAEETPPAADSDEEQ